MIAGVIRLGPSQLKPWNGSANVFEAIPTWYSPSRTRSKANVPSCGGRGRVLPAAVGAAELDRDAGEPDLLALDLARRAAAGLEVPPDDAGDPALERLGLDGVDGVLGDLGRADRRQAEQRRRRRARAASSSVKPLSVEPVRSSVDGRARRQHARVLDELLDADDRRVDRAALGILLVHDPPDHADREQRDGERDEDGDLEGRRPPHALGQHGEDEPDRRHRRTG